MRHFIFRKDLGLIFFSEINRGYDFSGSGNSAVDRMHRWLVVRTISVDHDIKTIYRGQRGDVRLGFSPLGNFISFDNTIIDIRNNEVSEGYGDYFAWSPNESLIAVRVRGSGDVLIGKRGNLSDFKKIFELSDDTSTSYEVRIDFVDEKTLGIFVPHFDEPGDLQTSSRTLYYYDVTKENFIDVSTGLSIYENKDFEFQFSHEKTFSNFWEQTTTSNKQNFTIENAVIKDQESTIYSSLTLANRSLKEGRISLAVFPGKDYQYTCAPGGEQLIYDFEEDTWWDFYSKGEANYVEKIQINNASGYRLGCGDVGGIWTHVIVPNKDKGILLEFQLSWDGFTQGDSRMLEDFLSTFKFIES